MMKTAAEEPPQKHVDTLTETTEQIKLISADDKIFYVNRDVVEVSKHLKTTLASSFVEGATRQIKLDNIKADILEICIKYMHYKMIYQYSAPDAREKFNIEPLKALKVLNAAIYLEC
jgi:hypothetical protein